MNLVQAWSWDLKPQSSTRKTEDEQRRNKYVRTENAAQPSRRGPAPHPPGYMSPVFKSHCDRLMASVAKGRTYLRHLYPHRDKTATRLREWAQAQPNLIVGLGYSDGRTEGRPSFFVELKT